MEPDIEGIIPRTFIGWRPAPGEYKHYEYDTEPFLHCHWPSLHEPAHLWEELAASLPPSLEELAQAANDLALSKAEKEWAARAVDR